MTSIVVSRMLLRRRHSRHNTQHAPQVPLSQALDRLLFTLFKEGIHYIPALLLVLHDPLPVMCPDTSRTENTICAFPNCQRSVWKDPDGSFSAYCGKGHRDAMAAQNVSGANILCKVTC